MKAFSSRWLATALIGIGLIVFPATGHAASAPKKDDAAEQGEMEKKPPWRKEDLRPLPKGDNQPWLLIRVLQNVQDEIAAGVDGSLKIYRGLLIQIAQWLREQPGETWTHLRNLDAIAVYTLIGGDPKIAKRVLQLTPFERAEKLPLIAAIAYAERDYDTASQTLLQLDHTKLPPFAAGQFALSKAMMTSSESLGKATEFLDETRRLSPGTLLEEAALRRLVRIAAERELFESMLAYANIYMRRFPKSLFLNDFLRNYSFGLSSMSEDQGAVASAHLQDQLKKLNKTQKQFLLTLVVRSAAIFAKRELGQSAAEMLDEFPDSAGRFQASLDLYASAINIVEPDRFDAALEKLEKLDRSKLAERELELYDAVIELAHRVGYPPVSVEEIARNVSQEHQMFPEEKENLPFDLEEIRSNVVQNNQLIESGERLDAAKSLLEKL